MKKETKKIVMFCFLGVFFCSCNSKDKMECSLNQKFHILSCIEGQKSIQSFINCKTNKLEIENTYNLGRLIEKSFFDKNGFLTKKIFYSSPKNFSIYYFNNQKLVLKENFNDSTLIEDFEYSTNKTLNRKYLFRTSIVNESLFFENDILSLKKSTFCKISKNESEYILIPNFNDSIHLYSYKIYSNYPEGYVLSVDVEKNLIRELKPQNKIRVPIDLKGQKAIIMGAKFDKYGIPNTRKIWVDLR